MIHYMHAFNAPHPAVQHKMGENFSKVNLCASVRVSESEWVRVRERKLGKQGEPERAHKLVCVFAKARERERGRVRVRVCERE